MSLRHVRTVLCCCLLAATLSAAGEPPMRLVQIASPPVQRPLTTARLRNVSVGDADVMPSVLKRGRQVPWLIGEFSIASHRFTLADGSEYPMLLMKVDGCWQPDPDIRCERPAGPSLQIPVLTVGDTVSRSLPARLILKNRSSPDGSAASLRLYSRAEITDNSGLNSYGDRDVYWIKLQPTNAVAQKVRAALVLCVSGSGCQDKLVNLAELAVQSTVPLDTVPSSAPPSGPPPLAEIGTPPAGFGQAQPRPSALPPPRPPAAQGNPPPGIAPAPAIAAAPPAAAPLRRVEPSKPFVGKQPGGLAQLDVPRGGKGIPPAAGPAEPDPLARSPDGR